MARRSSSDPARRVALLAVAAGLAAAIAAAGARLARRSRQPTDTGIEVHDSYTCTCGAEYRMSGVDRHRVFWPAGASDSEPVLGDRCPNCDAPLPAGHETAVR